MPSSIEKNISSALGHSFSLTSQQGVAGGSINQANRITGLLANEAVHFFIKYNTINRLDMFTAEAEGLREIEQMQSIRVPRVICAGVDEQQSYLVLEDLSLSSSRNNSAHLLGQNLAKLHRQTAKQFGWHRNNTIGSTPQINNWTESWPKFWRQHRLGFQLQLAQQNGAARTLYNKGRQLLDKIETFFIGYDPVPSLLHGDLWSGNYGYLDNGEPVIFDPAVYYGDREADIAMTELFGGFPREFYAAYNEEWVLDEGYVQRKTLYNLYHVLNHFNLFGGGYALQAENMIEQLLK